MFITFEGVEGSGKTTQISMLADYLKQRGKAVVVTREPGGTESAEAIRSFLMDNKQASLSAKAETLMFLAARSEHVEKLIIPSLKNGNVVLCDRFSDSTLVYQGIARGLGLENVIKLQLAAIGEFIPNITFLLDIDPNEGLIRAKSRSGEQTRFDEMDIQFHQNVREGFLQLAKFEPDRIKIINAQHEAVAVHKAIVSQLNFV